VSVAPSKPREYWRWPDHTITYLNLKKEIWVNISGLFSATLVADEAVKAPERDGVKLGTSTTPA